jgi:putative serine protease PepD
MTATAGDRDRCGVSQNQLEDPMLTSALTVLRRHTRLLAPIAAAITASAAVAGIALATSSTGTGKTITRTTGSPPSSTTVGLAAPAGVALQSAIVDVVHSVSPSVVQIEDRQGLGSGIILDAAGHIVTNNHVVSGATSSTVTTSNGTRYPAALVGSFAPDDLAVIKISGAHLKPATFADSSRLQVGDLAIAIGNPLGLRSSVTDGIVSAFRAAVPESNNVTLPSVIQTSAAINPGNSGGALVDIEGRVIGIPTLAATDPQLGGSAPGIGFAIPSNLVTQIAGQIVAHGKVVDSRRAYLGIQVGDTNGSGAFVGSVTAGGPAAKAGMHVGDVIVSVDGKPISTAAELSEVLTTLKPGRRVPVVVSTQNGRKTTLLVTLGTYPGS